MKPSSAKKRMGMIGLVHRFMVDAGFGEYFTETKPGVWEPLLEDGKHVIGRDVIGREAAAGGDGVHADVHDQRALVVAIPCDPLRGPSRS